jgi:4-amino-4-deoxy-L-arabinose transferase-like glycosyltransferase
MRWTQSRGGHATLLALALALGVFARTWEYGQLPPGLNADEASIGVEAYDLAHYGADRNGVALPVHFISWGSGQNALYGYVLTPFVAALGLSPFVVRVPMLALGLMSLPLMYFVGSETFGPGTGLLATFFLAISPWHILLSRWALESNLLPFVFLAGYACLLLSLRRVAWFTVACILFGLALYAYGTAYAAVPVFVLCAVLILLRGRAAQRIHIGLGVLCFVLVAAPIGLFLAVNSFGLSPIRLGPLTVPHLPVQARYAGITPLGQGSVIEAAAWNLGSAFKVLATESDGLIYNVVDPYGFFYHLGLPVALVGIVALLYEIRHGWRTQHALLLAWIAACVPLMILQSANINRLNLLFMPMLVCGAFLASWLARRVPAVLPVTVITLLAAFAAFTAAYHGEGYRGQISSKFHEGLLTALRFAATESQNRLCVTDNINMPYIFALFSGHTSPAIFLETVKYVDAAAPLRQVQAFGRYTFGTENCTDQDATTYVLTTEELPPRLGNRYSYEFFDHFVVYYPKP